jgi:hypothetical protein
MIRLIFQRGNVLLKLRLRLEQREYLLPVIAGPDAMPETQLIADWRT